MGNISTKTYDEVTVVKDLGPEDGLRVRGRLPAGEPSPARVHRDGLPVQKVQLQGDRPTHLKLPAAGARRGLQGNGNIEGKLAAGAGARGHERREVGRKGKHGEEKFSAKKQSWREEISQKNE